MIELLRKTFYEWNNDRAPQLAAALAYYAIFSIFPLMIIALAVAGYFFNANTARAQLIDQISKVVGPQTATFLQSVLENTTRTSNGLLASTISVAILLIGASGFFLQLQEALNTIWGVRQPQDNRINRFIKNHFRSFLMVLATGGLLVIFLILSAVVSVLTGNFSGGAQNSPWPGVINFLVMFVMITLLFALIYREVPDKEITWMDVWLGAAVTALLFMLGRYAIGFYLAFSNSGSAYGAAGSLIVLLIWIYYSAQIFLLGAEFTQVYAKTFGSCKRPERIPVRRVEELSPPATLPR
jgi:membrane protein